MSNRKKPRRPWLRKDARTQVNGSGLVRNVEILDDEKELLKEVPAKVDGTVVGKALLYDDGSVDLMLDKDAPEWALNKIKSTAEEFGYSIGTE